MRKTRHQQKTSFKNKIKPSHLPPVGNEVSELINEEKQIGSYELEFNATILPSGIYFYKLRAGVFAETKKMVLMR